MKLQKTHIYALKLHSSLLNDYQWDYSTTIEELRKDSGLDIDENLQELSEKNKVADHITQIQNSRYMDEDESFNMDGFV